MKGKRKMKRFTALFLVFVMLVSMAACGKSKEELDKAREVDASGVKTIEDAVAIAPKYTDGTYELSIKADVSGGSAMGVNMDILVSGSKANLDMSVDSIKEDCSLKYNGKEFKIGGEIVKPLVVKGDRLYVDFDAIAKGMLLMDTQIGAYGLLIPKLNSTSVSNFNNSLSEYAGGAVAALAKGADVKESDGEFTLTFKDGNGIRDSLAALLDYVGDSKDKADALVSNAKDLVDIKDYTGKLIDDVKDDAIGALNEFDLEIEPEAFDNAKEQIADEVEEYGSDGLAGFFDGLYKGLDDMKEELADLDDDDWTIIYEYYKMLDPKISVKASSTEYSVNIAVELSDDAGEELFGTPVSGTVNISYVFKTGYVSIFKPSGVKSLTDIAKYVKENQDMFTEKFTSLSSKFTGAGDLDEIFEALDGEVGAGALVFGILTPSLLKYVAKARQVRDYEMEY